MSCTQECTRAYTLTNWKIDKKYLTFKWKFKSFFSSWWILKLSLSQNTNTTISFLFNRTTCLFEYHSVRQLFVKAMWRGCLFFFFLCSIVAHIPIHICNFVRRQMAIDMYLKKCPHHCHPGGYTPIYCPVLPKSYLEKYILGYSR